MLRRWQRPEPRCDVSMMQALRLFALLALTAGPAAALQSAPVRVQRIVPATPVAVPATPAPQDPAAQPAQPGQDAPPAGGEEPEELTEEQKQAAEEAAAEAEKQKRLGKIPSFHFDRRPSAILDAWSTPPAEEQEAEEEEQPVEGAGEATEGTEEGEQAEEGETAAEAEPEPDPFDVELEALGLNLTLGHWPSVREYLASQDEEVGKALYARILTVLKTPPPQQGPQVVNGVRLQPTHLEKYVVSFEDVLGLASAAPHELDQESIQSLSALLRLSLASGHVIEAFLAHLRAQADLPEEERILTDREAAKILMGAGRAVEAGEFLPDVETATGDEDHEALNMLSRHLLARYAEDKKTAHLEQAWHVTQAIFASDEVEEEQKDEALKRAVELAPKIRDELGLTWLEESFTSEARRGMDIVAAIGSASARGIQHHPRDAAFRLKGLELQKTAVEALLAAAPDRATEWRASLGLLAANWLSEAIYSYQFDQSTSRGPQIQRDSYGNIYYIGNTYRRQNNLPTAIPTGEILDVMPAGEWLDLVDPGARPKFDMVSAQLLLKVNEEDAAFPYIEQLARTHPDQAKDLVEEFLRVWTNNHDPNASRRYTNTYMFMFGFERRAEGIPLTRSKQERNLAELSEWVRRLRALPIEDPDEELLVRAFTKCHSTAEVYRLEAIESVFGDIEQLEPETLAELAQQMRTNLATVWRQPAEQKNKNTRRRQGDLRAEVLRGYSVAAEVISNALADHPDEWSLQLAGASIAFDENNYRRELKAESDFTEKRASAFAEFRRAADSYAAVVEDLPEEEESTRVYELWFYASLGACDLGDIDHEKSPDPTQAAHIRAAIEALPGEAATRHMDRFANLLFTRMSALSPAVKYRYLRSGFEIVGDDNKAAFEARKVFDYYRDLVTEIQLETIIDGRDVVGHEEPFGLFVNIRHTKEIERESGGFGRYLQNQNTSTSFTYNYGRPTEDYRDKFEEAARQSLQEHFEVLSVTFENEDVTSSAVEEYGWRRTPYAYLLLQPRGPQIDTIPSLRLDLDFLDTSGYAVLPVESPAIPIDAAAPRGEPRPVTNLQVTQTLDERQAREGKLILEVQASARGLVPDLDAIVDLEPEGFEIESVEDTGVAVSRFDEESDDPAVVSERGWMVTMRAADEDSQPASFRFASALADDTQLVFQRYADADLLEVGPEIDFDETYGERSYAWLLGVALLAALGIGAAVTWRRMADRTPVATEGGLAIPENLTPFTVLGFLQEVREQGRLSPDSERELAQSIERIEASYFRNGSGAEVDLREVAEDWMRRSRNGAARV